MATSLNKVVPQRDSGYQSVQTLRRTFTFNDFPTGSLEKVVGGLPANAIVVGGGTICTTLVGAQTIGIGYRDYDGTTTSPAVYATAVALTATTGFVALDELAVNTNQPRTVATQVIVTASAAMSAGEFTVIIFFVTKNPTSGAGA
jgi:hypothetical protein